MKTTYLKDLLSRLRHARLWVAGQFAGILLLILVGLAWTRLPEKHVWQVVLSLLLPVVLPGAALVLQAGTVRSLLNDARRVGLVSGTATLLVWAAVAWACWALLDWCDDQFPEWAGYLNSRASSHARASFFTYEHILQWLGYAEWVLRWLVVPAKTVPYAAASAQWGWRLPWRRVLRIVWNWRWWLTVVVTGMLGVLLPSRFFAGGPSGTVSTQVWAVSVKLFAAYVLGVSCWVLLLGWVAVIFGRQAQQPPAKEALVNAPVLTGPKKRTGFAAVDVPPEDEGNAA